MANISEYLANIENAVYGEEVRGSIHDAIAAINEEAEIGIDQAIKEAVATNGRPLVANNAAEMIDETKVYVYIGNEQGYTYGHWYVWNGNEWSDGGQFIATDSASIYVTGETLYIE